MENQTNTQDSKFVAAVKARLAENSDANVAITNEKKAGASLRGQIASLESKLVNDELAVDEAKEALEQAIYPTSRISSDSSYVENIKNKKAALSVAEDNLTATKETIEFYKSVLANKF